jgi:hypothetical protein
MVMEFLDEIAEKVINPNSLFNSALATWTMENHVDVTGELYTLLAYDETRRLEIANEAVKHCGKHVADKRYWMSVIERDAFLGAELRMIFEGLKMLCEVPIDKEPLPSPAEAWERWKLQTRGQDVEVETRHVRDRSPRRPSNGGHHGGAHSPRERSPERRDLRHVRDRSPRRPSNGGHHGGAHSPRERSPERRDLCVSQMLGELKMLT